MVSNVIHEKTTFTCMKNIICRDIIYYGTCVSSDTGKLSDTRKTIQSN